MDVKKIIKNITLKDVAIVLFVPTVIAAGYYGYKAYKKHKEGKESDDEKEKQKWKGNSVEAESKTEETKEEIKSSVNAEKKVKVDVISEIQESGKVEVKPETKVIPITAGAKDEEKKETETLKIKEA